MDLFKKVDKDLDKIIKNYIKNVEGDYEKYLKNIRFSIPPVKTNSHYSANAGMVLAKLMQKPAPVCAEEIASEIKKLDYIEKVELAGAYINMTFKSDLWEKFLTEIVIDSEHFGDGENGKEVLLEFVSTNPTGPLHIGHCRGAILGLAIANIMKKAGYKVTKEYYINDYGVQISRLVKSIQIRYEQHFGNFKNQDMPEGCYPGEYLIDYAKKLAEEFGNKFLGMSEDEFYKENKVRSVDAMMDIIRSDLRLLGIEFDNFVSETAIAEAGKIEAVVDYLSTKSKTVVNEDGQEEILSYIYEGVLAPPKSQLINAEDEEENNYSLEPRTLFRSTLFGDDKDRVIVRANGQTTYFASDIAYHKDKVDRGYFNLINIFGADHGGYVKRLTSAVKAVSDEQANIDVLLCQMVNLERDGQPFKMSKRKGNFVFLSDLAEEMDLDELKLFMLAKSPDSQMTFDPVKVKEKSKDNQVYYIQYAHARTNSILKKFEDVFGCEYNFKQNDFDNFFDNASQLIKEIIVNMAKFPSVIQNSAERHSPNLVVDYLYNFSAMFHSIWGAGTKLVNLEDETISRKMMAFVTCVKNVIASALKCLNITPKQEM